MAWLVVIKFGKPFLQFGVDSSCDLFPGPAFLSGYYIRGVPPFRVRWSKLVISSGSRSGGSGSTKRWQRFSSVDCERRWDRPPGPGGVGGSSSYGRSACPWPDQQSQPASHHSGNRRHHRFEYLVVGREFQRECQESCENGDYPSKYEGVHFDASIMCCL